MKEFYRILFSVLILAFSACTPQSQAESSETPKDTEPIAAEFKVMSFNIKVDTTDDSTTANGWGIRKDACVEMIRMQKPAIIGLQEATFTNQWKWLKEELKDKYDGYGLNRDTGKESANGEVMGILYDKTVLQISDHGTFWLSETPDKVSKSWNSACNRTATWAIFVHKASGRQFIYINTHLDHKSGDARINGMRVISDRFEMYNPEGFPEILTGDFNTTSDDEAFLYIDHKMKNARSSAPAGKTDNYTTYNAWKESTYSVIDHIYVSKDVKVLKYATILDKYGYCNFISDHYPIVAQIGLK